jgi:tetratricopeptide (TPR) repeat protein
VAEVDCTLSIELDAKYSKAYFRRAQARFYLKKHAEAKRDYEEVLRLEPGNRDAQRELVKLEELIEGHCRVFPITKTEAQKSTKPLKLIRIEEIGGETVNQLELEKNLNELKQRTKLDAKDERLFKTADLGEKHEDKSGSSSIIPASVVKIEEVGDVNETSSPALCPVKSDVGKTVAYKNLTTVEADFSKKSTSVIIPDRPVNGYQFKKDWQFLNNNLDNLAVYFKVK